jgi:hypothetical protein
MNDTKQILKKRLEKLTGHFTALREYKAIIDTLADQRQVYDPFEYESLRSAERAVFEAFLKRFSAVQDYLGAKIFPLLLEVSGIGFGKMSDVLIQMEKEEIIDNVETWIDLRELRNELEHDYPDTLAQALQDLKRCVDHFPTLESTYSRVLAFTRRWLT